jgi:hypothetical protein
MLEHQFTVADVMVADYDARMRASRECRGQRREESSRREERFGRLQEAGARQSPTADEKPLRVGCHLFPPKQVRQLGDVTDSVIGSISVGGNLQTRKQVLLLWNAIR